MKTQKSPELRAYQRLLAKHGGFFVQLDGWRTAVVLKTGRKWVQLALVDGSKRKLSLAEWERTTKKPLVRTRGVWGIA